ncbi:MAG: peptidoglycan-binding domain-containing protein [Acidobacteriota bacterium]
MDNPFLKRGSTLHDAVERLQGALNDAGSLSVDGHFGPGTERAVKEFQAREALSADRKVGPATWGALGKYSEHARPLVQEGNLGTILFEHVSRPAQGTEPFCAGGAGSL